MKSLEALYSRDQNEGIRVWWVDQDGTNYRQNYGVKDGEIVTTEYTICLPKNIGRANETSGEEQREKEVAALYKKKLKTGYHKNIDDIDNFVFVEPMLAKKFEDRKDKIEYPVALNNKYNGGRCIATKDGLFTRKGERYLSVPHIWESLKDFFIEWPDAVLDGELLGDGFKANLNETMKLIRKTVHITAEDLTQSEKLVKYWVYDGYNFGGITKDSFYLDRANVVENSLENNIYYRKVWHIICNNEKEVYEQFQKLVEDGEEGAIVRLLNSGYDNKRSSSLLKVKSDDDSEAIITNITEGTGNWANTGKRITLNWNGKEFDATFKGSHEEATQFLIDKDKWIGRTVTFLYMGLTSFGIPNYARVDYNNCVKS